MILHLPPRVFPSTFIRIFPSPQVVYMDFGYFLVTGYIHIGGSGVELAYPLGLPKFFTWLYFLIALGSLGLPLVTA